MKKYNELTLRGKYLRCQRALERLEIIHHSHPNDHIYELLYYIQDNGLKNNEETVECLRSEILENNKHHGYTNYCPDKQVIGLLS